ncbi:hypothetical protein HU200_014847 [Digitaria exilis]|uniref:Uncharacterized protein n=1 Tax=Digitaria exilis TaxID=1010633 RepID=A0A835KIK9_9POAL|nr:hypothetical protein HU200_014847 [Digitaria exilis]CAB3471673.1 unnamed protein product [Digitaria exilis]
MEKTTTTPQPVCAQESLALLNCVAAVPYDRDRCLALVDALRDCITQKVLLTSLLFASPSLLKELSVLNTT